MGTCDDDDDLNCRKVTLLSLNYDVRPLVMRSDAQEFDKVIVNIH